MKKYADRYFKVEPWAVREVGFNSDYSEVSESIFSLGNEFMGLRGYFEEGYSGETLVGSYINGVYESRKLKKGGYKGSIESTEFMVNSIDWVCVDIICNGVKLDINKVQYEQFERILNLTNAVLTRSFVWNVDSNTVVKITFNRLLSMEYENIGTQKITFELLKGNKDVVLNICSSLDFSKKHMVINDNWWTCDKHYSDEKYSKIVGKTKTTNQEVTAISVINTSVDVVSNGTIEEKKVSSSIEINLKNEKTFVFEKLVYIQTSKSKNILKDDEILEKLNELNFEILEEKNKIWWTNQWKVSDIVIEGDEATQQGIRYSIFQLHQTLHTAENTAVIGAKGLTGEFYNGNTFWDSEVYCSPFYILNNPKAAKNILELRYETLGKAKERAEDLDLKGAFYPVATIDGSECCDLWQHANLQMQPSTSVFYGIYNYVRLTKDVQFMYEKGIEMLVEICRMLISRADYNYTGTKYGYYGVMGPDEFQMMVNHNCYTNYMAKKTLDYTVEILEDVQKNQEKIYKELCDKLSLTETEINDFKNKANAMYLPYDENRKIFEQHEGFFDLPNIDISKIPVEDFPLYHNWSYDRIYRNNMIKQPDVLMFLLLFNSDFSMEQLKANYEYYEPKCIHESSLSPSVHSIIAAQVGKKEEAYSLFEFATRMDLDNFNRNTNEGLHITSIAGSWLNIVYGFGGLRTDGESIMANPSIPKEWDEYKFNIVVDGVVLKFKINKECVELCTEKGCLDIIVYGKSYSINQQVTKINIQ